MGKACGKADLQLWAAYTRGMRLLPGRVAPAPEPPSPPRPVASPAAPPMPPAAGAGAFILQVDRPPPGLDRASWEKFRTGRQPAARTLDLHGMTAARAHRATLVFVGRAHAAELRLVEIITGKGEVLLRELPLWLNSPPLRPLILALAHPHPHNTGALRVLLRRAGRRR